MKSPEFVDAVRKMDAVYREYWEALKRSNAAKQEVIRVAQELGITDRVVVVVGHLGWYLDPPGVSHTGQWETTFGSPPEEITDDDAGGASPGDTAQPG